MIFKIRMVLLVGELVLFVFDSLYLGLIYLDDFGYVIEWMILCCFEDVYVEELFVFVVQDGVMLVYVLFLCCYIDLNCNSDDLDLFMIEGEWKGLVNLIYKMLQWGIGLIWRDMKVFGLIYVCKLIFVEICYWIDICWMFYYVVL